jgi:predicted lipoprotein with Yx(FWY)xxD motif
MSHSRPMSFLAGAAVLPVAALAVAAAGSGASAATAHPNTAGARTPIMSAVSHKTVQVRSTSLGKILVDSRGRTLYLFKKDHGTKSACSGACATAWPPLRSSSKPTVGTGLTTSKVGTTKRSDGSPQVTYNGHPLYRFMGDKKAGDTNGQGLNAFGGRWWVVSSTGNQITRSNASNASNGTTGGY